MTSRRTHSTLADGRSLFYFDADATVVQNMQAGAVTRDAVDSRDLPTTTTASEIRHDVLLDEWVVIASHRQGRTYKPPAGQCPLCPSRDGAQTEVPDTDYDVVVFENRFPSLSTSAGVVFDPDPAADWPFDRSPGIGRCEVVCFTSDHHRSFSGLSPAQVQTVMDAWVDRTAALSAIDGVELVFPFENRGEEIGVTLSHPHGQIYGYPFVPRRARRRLESARAHRDETGECLFCDILVAEEKAGDRIVASSEHWVAYVPWAARWPYEAAVYPRRHVPDLPALTAAEQADFGPLYLDVLGRFDALFDGNTPYIAGWHQAPVHDSRDLAHLSLQIFTIRRAPGKLKYLAGSESAMGVFINDITPEQAAARLREAL